MIGAIGKAKAAVCIAEIAGIAFAIGSARSEAFCMNDHARFISVAF